MHTMKDVCCETGMTYEAEKNKYLKKKVAQRANDKEDAAEHPLF